MSTRKEYALIAILTTIIIGAVPTFAQNSTKECPPYCTDETFGNLPGTDQLVLPITVSTDKAVYDHQSTIVVSGHVHHPLAGQDVAMKILSPQGNVVNVSQLTVDNNGDFIDKLNTASPLWQENGIYTIYVQQGDEQSRTNKVQFEISGETPAIPEFGPIAALVLAIAIISIIAVSAKTGLRFMPKY